MSLNTVRQLHSDLEKLAPKNAGQLSDPGLFAAFNANLEQSKAEHPDDKIIATLQVADKNTRVGDLLVRVGQLKASLEDYETFSMTVV